MSRYACDECGEAAEDGSSKCMECSRGDVWSDADEYPALTPNEMQHPERIYMQGYKVPKKPINY